MKQILQDLKTGDTLLEDIAIPEIRKNEVLIRTTKTLISSGTEQMLINFGKANLLSKAKQQPDKVNQALNKVKTDGLLPTFAAIRNKLSEPLPLGYCNVGTIERVFDNNSSFKVGDRVVSNGYHAEFVAVNEILCCKVPKEVDDREAVFVVPGSIALNGIRLANPSLGENYIVFGLGLIGLLTSQILLANGCNVIGLDIDDNKISIAKSVGIIGKNIKDISDYDLFAKSHFQNNLADGTIICTATTDSGVLENAAIATRKNGTVVLIGTAGSAYNRTEFYNKELSFKVARSYGPGRYDPAYEEVGHDYPYDYVRWTANRNFQAILELLSKNKLNTNCLISEVVKLENAPEAYKNLSNNIGTIIDFGNSSENNFTEYSQTLIKDPNQSEPNKDKDSLLDISFIGAGNYTYSTLLTAFKKAGFSFNAIVSKNGISGHRAQKKYGFRESYTNLDKFFEDINPKSLAITTRHNLHAAQLEAALKNNTKYIYLEKPLCINLKELDKLKSLLISQKFKDVFLMLGFNRRFSPHTMQVKKLIDPINSPKVINININAGSLAEDHWLINPEIGGGRIIGEACHFVDLANFLIGRPVISHRSIKSSGKDHSSAMYLKYDDGSIVSINYYTNGSSKISKEFYEVHVDGKSLTIDNFRITRGFGWKGFKKFRTFYQDKGQLNTVASYVSGINTGVRPMQLEEILNTTELTIKLSEELS